MTDGPLIVLEHQPLETAGRPRDWGVLSMTNLSASHDAAVAALTVLRSDATEQELRDALRDVAEGLLILTAELGELALGLRERCVVVEHLD